MESEFERVKDGLRRSLEEHNTNRMELQEAFNATCEDMHRQVDELENVLSSKLKEEYSKEENFLQNILERLSHCEEEEEEDRGAVIEDIKLHLALCYLAVSKRTKMKPQMF